MSLVITATLLVPDKVKPEHNNARQNALWGALMAGAWGIEWYFGYEHEHSDLTCEDWRTRDNMWDQSRYALEFFTQNAIPYWEMEPMDDLTENDDYVLAKEGEQYVIFQKMGPKQTTVLPEVKGNFTLRWFNPRTGEFTEQKEWKNASKDLQFDAPGEEKEMDWVVWVQKK